MDENPGEMHAEKIANDRAWPSELGSFLIMAQLMSRCRWCGTAFAPAAGAGRPARYCRRSHRQRAYEARLAADSHNLGPDDVLLSRSVFERVRDVLYLIEAALQDVDRDLAVGAELEEYRKAFWHLSEAAGSVRSVAFEPKAIGDEP